MRLSIKEIIQLHVAMMLREIYQPFRGLEVTTNIACDIAQVSFDFHYELKRFADNFAQSMDVEDVNLNLDDPIFTAAAKAVVNRSREYREENLMHCANRLTCTDEELEVLCDEMEAVIENLDPMDYCSQHVEKQGN
jgi:hypothetical protein